MTPLVLWYLLFVYYSGAIASTPFVVLLTLLGFNVGYHNRNFEGMDPYIHIDWPFSRFFQDWYTNPRIRSGITWVPSAYFTSQNSYWTTPRLQNTPTSAFTTYSNGSLTTEYLTRINGFALHTFWIFHSGAHSYGYSPESFQNYICQNSQGGVHGNEPAGSEALNELVKTLKLKKGELIVIPKVNEFGLMFGTRYNLSLDPDINRNYEENGGRCEKSRSITKIISNADLVIDLHEGWGFHLVSPNSIGSTISPSSNILGQTISKKCVDMINKTISMPTHKFQVLGKRSCEIPNSLACYCERKQIPYILVETPGQNNVQPLELRKKQHLIIVKTALAYLHDLR